MEPKPGIPPSPAHAKSLINCMKQAGVKIIIMEPFYPRKFPDMIARETGAHVVIVPSSVGAMKGINTYFDLFDELVRGIATVLE